MGAHFNFTLEDMNDEASFARAVGSNQVNITPQGTAMPLRTTLATNPNPQKSLTTWNYSDIMQGVASLKPTGATYDVFNQSISADFVQILGENGGVDELLGHRAKFAPYDIVNRGGPVSELFGTGSQTAGDVVMNTFNSSGNVGTNPTQAETPEGPTTVVTVRGIVVRQDIAGQLDAMLAAAEAEGIHMGGWGWRDHQRQIELRTENGCPDVWTARASTCRVPTAIPGTSRHEYGRAIDFTQNGSTLTRSTSAFNWLKANAATYGFINLPSEAWHWSTDGN